MQSDQRFRDSFPGRVHQDWDGQRNKGGNGKVGGVREPVGRVRKRAWCREGAELGQNVDLVRKGKGGGGWRHQRQRLGEEGGCL